MAICKSHGHNGGKYEKGPHPAMILCRVTSEIECDLFYTLQIVLLFRWQHIQVIYLEYLASICVCHQNNSDKSLDILVFNSDSLICDFYLRLDILNSFNALSSIPKCDGFCVSFVNNCTCKYDSIFVSFNHGTFLSQIQIEQL